MVLIVEDGSGVAGANSYRSLAGIREFATKRGFTLTTDDDELTAEALKCMDYIESYRDQYSGDKLARLQSTQWPRRNATIDGFVIPDNEIPVELGNALSQCIIETSINGVELNPVTDGGHIIEETVGPITTRWASDRGAPTGGRPIIPSVDDLLEPLFGSAGFGLRTVRV